MKLEEVRQIDIKDLPGQPLDAILADCICTKRDLHLAELLRDVPCGRHIVFSSTDREYAGTQSEDLQFMNLGYESQQLNSQDSEEIRPLLEDILGGLPGGTVSLMVDYSSMPSIWYGAIIDFFAQESTDLDRADVYFSYTPADFAKPPSPTPNIGMKPVLNHWNLQLPDKETALLVDLGCERGRATGLVEYLKPAETYVFHADAFPDPSFIDALIDENSDLIQRLGEGRMIAYPYGNPEALYQTLTSLCSKLSENYRVIVAPLGPKPFSLLSLLLSVRLPVFDVWEVVASPQDELIDRRPIGPVLVCKATFSRQ